MKTIKFYLWALFVVMTSVSFIACSDDEDDSIPTPTPTPTPTPDPDPEPELTTHFDIWVSIGSNSGMGSDVRGWPQRSLIFA